MKTVQKYLMVSALIALFASCQTSRQALSTTDSRMDIMTTIANDHEMSKEMLDVMMKGDHGKMLMHERMMKMMKDKSMMKKMMKNDPEMTKSMMSDMMETVKSDTSMMSHMCKSMMNNPEMMEMMQKMKEKDKAKSNR